MTDLLHEMSEFVEKVFHQRGIVEPMWLALDRDGVRVVVPPPNPFTSPDAKDACVALVRTLFEIKGVTQYAYTA